MTYPLNPLNANNHRTSLGPRNGSGTRFQYLRCQCIINYHHYHFSRSDSSHVRHTTDICYTLALNVNGVHYLAIIANSPFLLLQAVTMMRPLLNVNYGFKKLTSSADTGGSKLFSFLTAVFIEAKNAWDAATSNRPVFTFRNDRVESDTCWSL